MYAMYMEIVLEKPLIRLCSKAVFRFSKRRERKGDQLDGNKVGRRLLSVYVVWMIDQRERRGNLLIYIFIVVLCEYKHLKVRAV